MSFALTKPITVHIWHSNAKRLDQSITEVGYERLSQDAPVTKADMALIRESLPPALKDIPSEQIAVQKYVHQKEGYEVGMIDYRIHQGEFTDPILVLPADMPRRLMTEYAKVIRRVVVEDMASAIDAVMCGKSAVSLLKWHVEDHVRVLQELDAKLFGREVTVSADEWFDRFYVNGLKKWIQAVAETDQFFFAKVEEKASRVQEIPREVP